jgi:putative hemolysin
VSEEEVKSLLQEGTLAGVFNREEKDIVERTFQLDEKKIISFMTPRKEITWLDIDGSFKNLHGVIGKNQYSYFPVCRDGLDKVLGVVRTKDLLATLATEQKIDLTKTLRKPLYVPETMEGLKVLEVFKRTGMHMAFVVDEYGSILGLLSLSDILEEIVGDIPDLNELDEQEIIKRKDGTFLVDGLIPIDEFKKYFKINKLPDENSGAYHTFGGFVMDRLDRIPNLDDTFEFNMLRFKVFAMDGNRVEKVLIEKLANTP